MAHVAGAAAAASITASRSRRATATRTSTSSIRPTSFRSPICRSSDPETGVTDGLLSHATKPEFQPNIFYTNSSYEYWGRAASLIHTTVDGARDMPLPPNVRSYLLAAGQHGVAAFPPSRTIGQQSNNPLDYRWAMRSLLVAMNRWVADGTAPPASAYPRIDQGTLVAPDSCASRRCRRVNVATTPHKAYRADYGPEFVTKGMVSQEPPNIGTAFPILVPQVDADGNELAGIRMPELSVPLATYTGWNLFNERSGPPDRGVEHAGLVHPARAHRSRSRARRRSATLRSTSAIRAAIEYLAQITKAATRSRPARLRAQGRRRAHRRSGGHALGSRRGEDRRRSSSRGRAPPRAVSCQRDRGRSRGVA